jgi:hypothetical protein
LWKPNWACTTCGMLSSRRYSVKRHIINLHGGNGFDIPFVDYMQGRLIGIYKPDDSKQQQSSAKYSTFFDTFYRATKRLDASSSFFSSSYSNPFIMPYMRSEVYRYPSAKSNFYSEQSYKGMKPSSTSSSSSATPAPSQDLVSQMTTEFCLEYVKELARKAVSAATSTTTTPQPNMQSSLIQGGLGNNSILDVQNKQEEDVFGYRFKICKDCLLTHPLQVRYGKDGTKDNSNNDDDDTADVVARIEQKHVCDPQLVASNRKKVLDKEGSVKAMVDELPKNTIRMTKSWIKNQKKNYSLIAIKIPHKSKNQSNIAYNSDNIEPEQQNIKKISNPKNPKQQITFQYSKEKHVNLSLTSNESSKNHYAARAINNGGTILANDEMEDFLKMIQTSTFAIFKIRISSTTTASSSSSLPLQHQHQHQQQQDESIGLYFLALLPYDDTLYPASWLPNKSNNNNNNNNKSVQSNSRDENFSSLYNHLANISNFTIPIVNSQSSLSLSSS